MDDRRWRLWGALLARCAWSGILIQVVRVTERLGSVVDALARLSLFFTIFSNLAVGIVYGAIALGLVRFRHPLLIAGLALTMLLVCAVFETLIRPYLSLSGLRLVSNTLLHDVVPVLCVAAWLVLARKGLLRPRDPWIIAVFPILYLLYALARGAIGGIYPYPFLDPARIGWRGVSLYVVSISAIFLITGHLLVAFDRFLSRGQ
jgi:hypothetical protein